MKKLNKQSRRKFVKQSSTAMAGFYIVPRHVLGKGFTPPSDQLNLAAIGAGGKGRSDLIVEMLQGQLSRFRMQRITKTFASCCQK